ncbi:MAG: 30S ribosomal protein S1, partial [Solirubrobacteraceae bacterium]
AGPQAVPEGPGDLDDLPDLGLSEDVFAGPAPMPFPDAEGPATAEEQTAVVDAEPEASVPEAAAEPATEEPAVEEPAADPTTDDAEATAADTPPAAEDEVVAAPADEPVSPPAEEPAAEAGADDEKA